MSSDLDLTREEENFMKEHQNDVYEFFGYPNMDPGEEMPFFYRKNFNNGDNANVDEFVYPFSPKTLEFCVNRLSKEQMLREAEALNMAQFRAKCLDVAYFCDFKEANGNWKEWIRSTSRLCALLKNEAANYYYEEKEAQPE